MTLDHLNDVLKARLQHDFDQIDNEAARLDFIKRETWVRAELHRLCIMTADYINISHDRPR